MSNRVFVLNGPNLNALGQREPDIYGALTLQDIEKTCIETGTKLGFEVDFRQSNHEGVLIDWLYEADQSSKGIVFNSAAYTHTSVALHDAVKAISVPVIEVHLSNVHARESFRHTSFISPVAKGVICGFGLHSYTLALQALDALAEN